MTKASTPTAAMVALLALLPTTCTSFLRPSPSADNGRVHRRSGGPLFALDPVTYLRTEWVSAALCTNQTPRSADKVLQLGCEDGRVVNFVPRTVREIITSSAESKDSPEEGGLTVTCRRQLRQMAERRQSAAITYSDQPADSLTETPSSTVDVVISLQSAQRMAENGLDWKRSIAEAGRVLKPGGRFLFVESAEVGGESYLEEVMKLSPGTAMEEESDDVDGENATENESGANESDANAKPLIFSEVGFDNVDMVLQPHVAGVAIKALDADLTSQQRDEKRSREEEDRLAELSLSAFERGSKKRRRKEKKEKGGSNNNDKMEEMGVKSG